MIEETEPWQLAVEAYQAGDLDNAEAFCKLSLAENPNDSTMLHLMGLVTFHLGREQAPYDWLTKAIEIDPDNAEIHHNLGMVFWRQGLLEQTKFSFQRAIEKSPPFVQAHIGLSLVLQQLGQYEEAVSSYRCAVQLQPDDAELYFGMGKLLHDQGRRTEAIVEYERAIQLRQEYPEALLNLGTLWHEAEQYPKAIEAYRRCIEFRPTYAAAHRNLGNSYDAQGNSEAAIACYERAAEIQPGFGLATLVNQLQHRCRWNNLEMLSRQVIASVEDGPGGDLANVIMPFCFISLPIETTPSQQLRCAQNYIQLLGVEQPISRPLFQSFTQPSTRRKIRLGYLSADFRDHPVAYLVAELFESHDRNAFEVIGYSIGPKDEGPYRRRIMATVDRFRDLKEFSDYDAAKIIAEDAVDILIDLQGFTQYSRTKILAFRPSPIQVNYLGYPGTMGTQFIDYILVDDFVVPSDQQPFFSEQLVHLPGCFLVNDSRRSIDERTPPRRELGLPEKAFVFCAFSSSHKLAPNMFDLWLRLLQAVPNAILWLRDNNAEATIYLRAWALQRGIDPKRLIFASTVAMPQHLARQRVADLFLDTFPYNQHSTASDALRVGLPLMTLSGDTFASRVAGSLLRELGLTELIAHSYEEYEALAIHLATTPSRLDGIRGQLAERLMRTELYSGKSFAKKIEAAYHEMWTRHQIRQHSQS